jgi:sugar phosphate isomerase/epimerase
VSHNKPSPELAALTAAITAFIDERRRWPPARSAQARREIRQVQALLIEAAAALGVKLVISEDGDSGKRGDN